MPTVHYLNVRDGDCSVIQHISGHISVIDVNYARIEEEGLTALAKRVVLAEAEKGTYGNFNQKQYPVNPIEYMRTRGLTSVFRFILTGPDMDHMDGIRDFFTALPPTNLWDTDNNSTKDFTNGSRYRVEDWEFYRNLRDSNPQTDPKRLTLYSGAEGQFYNRGADGQGGGDGLHVLAPTDELLRLGNECGDHNDCSYVVLYRTGKYKIVFAGDSHDKTWEHILSVHREAVRNVDLLIAPHHGRASDRSYDFLDVLRPRVTFFGNAPSEHLAYGAWSSRDLWKVTNNQAGCMIMDFSDKMRLYVTHRPFAALNPNTFYNQTLKAWFCAAWD